MKKYVKASSNMSNSAEMCMEALKDGYVITVIPADKDYDPAMFYIKRGKFYTYSPNMGLIPRDDFDEDRVYDHFKTLISEGDRLFIAGYVE